MAASDGTNYLVVWFDGASLNAVRLDGSGNRMDSTAIQIASIFSISTAVVGYGVVWDGQQYVVSWNGGRNGVPWIADVYFCRITADGTVKDPGGIRIPSQPGEQDSDTREVLALASNGDATIVIWNLRSVNGSEFLNAMRINRDGTTGEPHDLTLTLNASAPFGMGFAGNSAGYFLTWANAAGIQATRITSDGVRVDVDPIIISSSGAQPAATALQDSIYVAWFGPDGVYATRVGIGNPTLVEPPQRVAESSSSPQGRTLLLSHDDSKCLLLARYGYPDGLLFGDLVDPLSNSAVRPHFQFIHEPNNEFKPAIAFGGTNYLAVWADDRLGPFGSATIFGMFEDRYGQPLADAAIQLNNGGGTDCLIAYNGTNYCLVYSSPAGPMVARTVSPAGTEGDEIPAGGGAFPAICWTGEKYLVVWDDMRDSYSSFDVYIPRVHVYGAFIQNSQSSAAFPIATNSNNEQVSAVAGLNGKSLIAWQHGAGTASIDARIVEANGSVGPEFTLGSINVGGDYSDFRPVVAAGPDGWLVVWRSYGVGGSKVLGARIGADGTLLDSIPITIVSGYTANVSATYSGNAYFVVWQDFRTSAGWQVFGARVSTDGVTLDPNGIPITQPTLASQRPVVSGYANEYVVITAEQTGATSRLASTYVSFDFPLIQQIDRGASETALSFVGWPGGSYVLQSKVSVDGEWADATQPMTATSGVMQIKDNHSSSSQFYRVEMRPSP